jgi:hypothetical protein
LIANPDFSQAGAAPGQAASWTLRSFCARQSIAPFAARTGADAFEGFERWFPWTGALAVAALAPFAPNGTEEDFDAWPDALFVLELSGGLVAGAADDGLEGWAPGAHFAWADVTAAQGVFAGGALESFDGWRPGDVYLLAFPDAALMRALFHAEPSEIFDAWTTKNTTL